MSIFSHFYQIFFISPVRQGGVFMFVWYGLYGGWNYFSMIFVGANASFRIDFQVYKSLQYNHSYGREEFPIYLAISNRIYFEVGIDKKDLSILPRSCYATKTQSYQDEPKYHLIQDRLVLFLIKATLKPSGTSRWEKVRKRWNNSSVPYLDSLNFVWFLWNEVTLS